jgi:hypothetical protein
MPGIMSVNEALVLLEADEDDCIVGQDGTAVYNDGLWRGTLTTLEPGKGYLLKTSSDKPLRLNNSRSSVRLHAPAMESQDDSEIWSVDIHRYPNVTPIIADLWDGYTLTSSVGYGLAAFVGDECRGVGETMTVVVNEQTVYYGYLRVRSNAESGETVSFKVFVKNANKETAMDGTIQFAANSAVGMPSSPKAFNINVYQLSFPETVLGGVV